VTLWQRGPNISQRKDWLTVRGRAPSCSVASSPRCGAARSTQQGARLSAESGLPYMPAAGGEMVAGTYRQRLTLTDNDLGFALVPWTPALDRHLGRHVTGVAKESGGIEWSFWRKGGWKSDGLFQKKTGVQMRARSSKAGDADLPLSSFPFISWKSSLSSSGSTTLVQISTHSSHINTGGGP
jgi:hypothetical protein